MGKNEEIASCCFYRGFVFSAEPEIKKKQKTNMTFSTLLTRLATCHCLWPAMSFVFRGLGPRSVSCTESANITPDSELWGEGGAATLLCTRTKQQKRHLQFHQRSSCIMCCMLTMSLRFDSHPQSPACSQHGVNRI